MKNVNNVNILWDPVYLGVLLESEREHSELVIQASARHRVTAGRVGTAHDPGGGQRQRVLLVRGERVLRVS